MFSRKSFFIVICGVVLACALGAGLFWWTKRPVYTSDVTKQGFITDMLQSVSNKLDGNKSRQGLIDAYCSATATAQGFNDPNAPGLYYDPQQSLFLGLLCGHSKTARSKIKSMTLGYDWEDLKIDGCTWNGSMNSCDFAVFLPKIFAIVMNDLSKTKVAQLYTYQAGSAEDAIKAFSDTYFGPGDSICQTKSSVYLSATQGSEKQAACSHPQTHAIIAQYLQQAQQLVDQTTYVNAPQLLKSTTKDCEKDTQQFLVCAFDTKDTTSRGSFHNTLYNELLFYKLFLTLAENSLQYPEYNTFHVYTDTSEEGRQEIIRLHQEADFSEDAVLYTEKSLQNMKATFPIHIGLLAYYEDILAVRTSLARIYTPIHQLYYKLRNVQQKK